MTRSLHYAIVLSLLALVVPFGLCRADEGKTGASEKQAPEQSESRFMRVTRDADDNPLEMQTAVKRYVPADESKSGPVVDLIAAVHIADASYFEKLNKDFTSYDALLYELVAPPGAVPRRGAARSNSFVSSLQNTMKDLLDLEFQLAEIDYRAENFVHADMSPDQFAKTMRERGESPLGMFMRMLRASAAQQQNRKRQPADPSLIFQALFDKQRGPAILKRIMADELSEADSMLEALNGKQGTTIITERNKVALKVLREQLNAGNKRIGIFYGSGHMIDMEKRLTAEFGLKLKETRWLTAWDLKEQPAEKPAGKQPNKKNPNRGQTRQGTRALAP